MNRASVRSPSKRVSSAAGRWFRSVVAAGEFDVEVPDDAPCPLLRLGLRDVEVVGDAFEELVREGSRDPRERYPVSGRIEAMPWTLTPGELHTLVDDLERTGAIPDDVACETKRLLGEGAVDAARRLLDERSDVAENFCES